MCLLEPNYPPWLLADPERSDSPLGRCLDTARSRFGRRGRSGQMLASGCVRGRWLCWGPSGGDGKHGPAQKLEAIGLPRPGFGRNSVLDAAEHKWEVPSRVGPEFDHFGRSWSELGEIGQPRAHLGQKWSTSGPLGSARATRSRKRPSLVELGADVTRVWAMNTRMRRLWDEPRLRGQLLSDCWATLANFGQLRISSNAHRQ